MSRVLGVPWELLGTVNVVVDVARINLRGSGHDGNLYGPSAIARPHIPIFALDAYPAVSTKALLES